MYLQATSIEDAWFQACQACLDYGRAYTIQRGSYAGERRWQLDSLTLDIPTPTIPATLTLRGQVVASRTQISDYFLGYILNATRPPKCDYTYGERIDYSLDLIVARITDSPQSNQHFIPIARPADVHLADPPCLQSITLQVVGGRLALHSFWRSWDVCNALPVNLGGLRLLADYISLTAGLSDNPRLYAYSSGAHIYEHSKKLWRS